MSRHIHVQGVNSVTVRWNIGNSCGNDLPRQLEATDSVAPTDGYDPVIYMYGLRTYLSMGFLTMMMILAQGM